jgi:hypothetical protein
VSRPGSDSKLPGSPDSLTVPAGGESGEITVPPVVACFSCVYCRPIVERPEGVEIDGDGYCFAELPGVAAVQAVHKLTQRTVTRLIASRPIVKRDDVCRRWRESDAFPGDAEIAQGEALEAISDTLGEVVRYLRELVQTGK